MAVNRVEEAPDEEPPDAAPPPEAPFPELPADEVFAMAPEENIAEPAADIAEAPVAEPLAAEPVVPAVPPIVPVPAPAPPAPPAPGGPPPPPVPPTPPPAAKPVVAAAAPADGGTPPDSTKDQLPEASPRVKKSSWAVVIVFLAAAAVALFFTIVTRFQDDDELIVKVGRWGALLFGIGTVAAGLLLIQLINSGHGPGKGYGVFRPLIGKDRRFSTSLTQLGLWTIAACTGFAFLLGRVMFDGAAFDVVIPMARWDEYLLLLGGPFAAAVLAKSITTYKLQEGTLQKSEPTTTTPSQVVKNDDGAADLVDAQYLLFNVVALGYYVVQLAMTSRLPEIPAPLLALTGATAAAFVGNQAAQRNAPTVTSVSPSTVEYGDKVTIYGTNFDPGDKQDPLRRVTVALSGYTETITTTSSSDTSASFTIPWAAQAGHQSVRLTTTAGVQSEPHDIEIRAKVAAVSGIDAPGSLRPGCEATLSGRNLGKPGDRVGVTIDTMLADATPAADGSRLRFTVPSYLPHAADASVAVTIDVPGQTAVTFTAPLEQPRIMSAWRQGDHLEMRAAGLSRLLDDFKPRVLVNARTAAAVSHLSNDLYSVALPAGLDIATELSLVAFDDLERKTAEYHLGA